MQTKIITNTLSKKSTKEYFNAAAMNAEKIIIAVAFFTDDKTILEQVALNKKVTLVVSLRPPTNYYSLKNLMQSKKVELLFLRDNFHSKIFAFYAKSEELFHGLVGSSNFSTNGLIRNIETNMISSHPGILKKIDKTLSGLISQAKVLTPELLADYKMRFDLFSEYEKDDQKKYGQEHPSPEVQLDREISNVSLEDSREFQEFIKSISGLSAAEFKKSIFNSKYSDISIQTPRDISEAAVAKVLCFTRHLEEPMPNSFKRVMLRFPSFKTLQDLPVLDFFNTKGIGAKAGKAFFIWYSKLHLGTYEEIVKDLSTNLQKSLLTSAFWRSEIKILGISDIVDLTKIDSDENSVLSPLVALEARTLQGPDAHGVIGSGANLYATENLLQCVNRFYQNEIDPKAREIVELRYVAVDPDQRTLQNIGLKLGLTRERVRQVLKKVHNTYKQRYIISTSQFYGDMISIIVGTQSPLEATNISSSISDTNQADIAMNFIADVFPELPVLGHLQSHEAKALKSYSNKLKRIMEDKTAVDLNIFIDKSLDSEEDILLKLYAIFAAPKYDLFENNEELQIIKSELSLMEAVHTCVSKFDRPASIEEVADALSKLDSYKSSGKDSFYAQKKYKGVGATSLFITLQRNDDLVRIERYHWGLDQQVAYQDSWDIICEAAAGIIGEGDIQYSAAYLFEELVVQFPLLRSRYELDYILKGSSKLKYLGYQTYTSLSAKNTERVTIRNVINEILKRQDKPMLIQDMLEEIGEVRTMDYRGIFTALSQFPEVINDSNKFVSVKKNTSDKP